MESNSQPDMYYFAIYDTKTNSYRDPILAMSEWDIVRDYERMCRDPKGQEDILITNAEDFQLFSVGSYQRSIGRISSWEPRHVVNFHQVKASTLRKLKPDGVDIRAAQDLDAKIKQLT